MAVGVLGEKLREITIAKIEGDKLDLPSMPMVAQKCQELLSQDDVQLPLIAREVEKDPVTAAQVLKIANSAALGGAITITSINQAVTRLGISKLRSLFLHLSARQVFRSHDPRIQDAFNGIWHHSLAVAVLSRDIAALMGGVQADVAYQTGLLHDIGKPIVGILLLEAEKAIGTAKAPRKWIAAGSWLQTVQDVHQAIAVALTRKWALSQDLQNAVANLTEYDVMDRKSVSNVVRFCNALTKKMGLYVGDVDQQAVETLIMVGRSLVGIDDKVLDGVTQDLSKRVDELLA